MRAQYIIGNTLRYASGAVRCAHRVLRLSQHPTTIHQGWGGRPRADARGRRRRKLVVSVRAARLLIISN